MNSKFHIGDEVRIIPNFHLFRFDDDPGIDDDMLKLAGTETVIKQVYENTTDTDEAYYNYHLEGNYWLWAEQWLEFADCGIDYDIEESDLCNILGGD